MIGKILFGAAALLAAGAAGYYLHDEINKNAEEDEPCVCKNPGGDCNYCDFEPECYPDFEADEAEFDCSDCDGCDTQFVCPASKNLQNNPWDPKPEDDSQEEEVSEDEKASE